MKILFASVLILLQVNFIIGQTTGKIIEGKKYKGVIFPAEYRLDSVEGDNYSSVIFPSDYKLYSKCSVNRWTSSDGEIFEMEKHLIVYLKKQSRKSILNQVDDCPNIYENINNYNRQYVGYISPKGEYMIYINCLWNNSFIKNWENRFVVVFDGCSYYWQIRYNVKKHKFSEFNINGLA